MDARFELLAKIGRGGMGTVWKARDLGSGQIVAVKMLHPVYADEDDYVARFEREVDIARRIDSPHVVKVLGYGQQDGLPYMAMEHVEGPSLRQFVRERGTLPWAEAKRIVEQVAEGLGAAHRAGVIHRDVKPSNILIGVDGTAKLADFGIARALDMTRLTGSSTMLGTPHYMAPEGEASRESDFYSLGCVAYEMLAGAPPFTGDSQQAVIAKHIRAPVDFTAVPEAAHPFLRATLAKDPAERPGSAAELLAILSGTASSRPRSAGARHPKVEAGASRSGFRGRRWGIGVAGALGSATLVGLIVMSVAATGTSGSGASPTRQASPASTVPPERRTVQAPGSASAVAPGTLTGLTVEARTTVEIGLPQPSLTPPPPEPTMVPTPRPATPAPQLSPTAQRAVIVPTATSTLQPTVTPQPTATPSPTATSTPRPTATPTRTPTPAPTPTPMPTATPYQILPTRTPPPTPTSGTPQLMCPVPCATGTCYFPCSHTS